MAVHGVFQKIQNWPFLMRLALQLTLLAIGLVFQWINVIRDNVNSGLFTISVLGLREVTFCDMIFVTCALLIVETSPWCQLAFGNIVMRMLGKLSAGMVLISPIIVYTIVPKIAQSMGDDDAAGSSVLGVGWLVTFLASFGLAMIFHFVLELPSKFLGEHFAELCTNWGRVTEEEAAIKAANAKAKAGIKAPNSVPAKIKNWLL